MTLPFPLKPPNSFCDPVDDRMSSPPGGRLLHLISGTSKEHAKNCHFPGIAVASFGAPGSIALRSANLRKARKRRPREATGQTTQPPPPPLGQRSLFLDAHHHEVGAYHIRRGQAVVRPERRCPAKQIEKICVMDRSVAKGGHAARHGGLQGKNEESFQLRREHSHKSQR